MVTIEQIKEHPNFTFEILSRLLHYKSGCILNLATKAYYDNEIRSIYNYNPLINIVLQDFVSKVFCFNFHYFFSIIRS